MTNFKSLETERLILRHWKISDLEPFAAMSRDERVMEYFPSTLSQDEASGVANKIQKQIEKEGFGFWACELKATNQFIGFIGLWKPDYIIPCSPCIEVGWRLAYPFWGQGYAVEGAKRSLKFGFEELGLSEIVSFTAVENFKSRRVMEKLGMIRDLKGDFDHPKVDEGHWLRPHVLYRIQKQSFKA